ncbi:hypothetical protein [Runella slithyformis]|uniref:Uncharacterized protein n=1 Tax=Runella slithyformis (strain ATCC 29530 / DSM 19594 / LMG 11500 / NCIMB 11436 / LSU 4) TaxID=761193 RepID=A0A7U3ZGF2_RUNSL|nr:hypothetical protein [Runella slithyformis]AEI46756.1 hypothetical protein Runsl_0304 [Runella slithyformis DSM 19594]
MKGKAKSIEQTVLKSIQDRLVDRFIIARDTVGPNWRKQLSEADEFFNTKVGADWMQGAASAVSSTRRASADRIERVVLALEKLAGIQNPPIV